jgi:hypothetical protein
LSSVATDPKISRDLPERLKQEVHAPVRRVVGEPVQPSIATWLGDPPGAGQLRNRLQRPLRDHG